MTLDFARAKFTAILKWLDFNEGNLDSGMCSCLVLYVKYVKCKLGYLI